MTRGRPRLEAGSPTTQVTVRLTVQQLDDLCREASEARLSVPELIRQKVQAPGNKRVEKLTP